MPAPSGTKVVLLLCGDEPEVGRGRQRAAQGPGRGGARVFARSRAPGDPPQCPGGGTHRPRARGHRRDAGPVGRGPRQARPGVTNQGPDVEYLSLEDLLGLVGALGAGPVRDLGLLDSACHRPRSGLLGPVVFLRINGYYLDLTDDEAFDLILSVAAGQFDAAEIEKRLRLVPVTR